MLQVWVKTNREISKFCLVQQQRKTMRIMHCNSLHSCDVRVIAGDAWPAAFVYGLMPADLPCPRSLQQKSTFWPACMCLQTSQLTGVIHHVALQHQVCQLQDKYRQISWPSPRATGSRQHVQACTRHRSMQVAPTWQCHQITQKVCKELEAYTHAVMTCL